MKVLEDELHVSVITRGEAINVTGEPEDATMAKDIFKVIIICCSQGDHD